MCAPRGAIQAGAAAEVAALSKERAWTAQAEAQGETFYPLAIEAGGTLNARFHEFLQLLAVASSPSPAERAAFMAFALQRIRAVTHSCPPRFSDCPWRGLPAV